MFSLQLKFSASPVNPIFSRQKTGEILKNDYVQ